MKSRSITKRVVGSILIAEFAAAIAFSILAFFHEERAQQRALDVAVVGRSDSLLGAIQDLEDKDDRVFIDPRELHLPAEDRWKVFNADRTPVGGSGETSATPLGLQETDGFHHEDMGGVGYRVLQHRGLRIIDRAETNGVGIKRPVILVYATPDSQLLHQSLRSASFYMLAALLVSALTAAGVAVFLRFSLRPIRDLAQAAERLSIPALQFTAPESVARISELQPLALTLTSVVERLRAAFEREKRFAGDAAHELKTAVAVLRSTIQVLMLRTRTPEEHQKGLLRALEDTRRLEALVMQILTLAQAEENLPAGQATADFAAAAERALEDLSPLAVQSEVTVSLKVEAVPPLSMSPDQAVVLVSNLLSNAIQHSSAHSEVRVSVLSQDGAVLLKISDEGDGIPAEALPYIFERFYRVDASRSRQTGGTGLGLAICKSIVEQAGGVIEVNSELGRGTVVTATFIAP